MTRIAWSVLALAAFIFVGTAAAADHAPPGSIWEGSIKVFQRIKGKPEFDTHNCRLVVLEREGEKFSGEFWWDNDRRGVAIEGAIASGGMRFTCTKELRGDAKDLVDNVRVVGRFRGKEMNELHLNFTVPGTSPRTGEIKVKLKE